MLQRPRALQHRVSLRIVLAGVARHASSAMNVARRRVRTCLTIVSGIVLLLTCLAWGRSKQYEDVISYWRELQSPADERLVSDQRHWRNVTVELAWGSVYIQRGTYAYDEPRRETLRWHATPLADTIWGCSPARPDVTYALAGF